jgi:transposase, IS30 family
MDNRVIFVVTKHKNMAQLSTEQRYRIAELNRMNYGPTAIMDATGIHKSTVSRELRRNGTNGVYDASVAVKRCASRRQRGLSKVCGQMKEQVDIWLEQEWSPEQICGRLAVEGQATISIETIYQYVYRDCKTGGKLYLHLRFSHKKRRKRFGKKDKRGIIPNKTMIDERPPIVEQKSRLGDYEGDTIIGKGHQGAAITLVDRCSKFTLIHPVKNKTADLVEQTLVEMLKKSPFTPQTLTFDNGKEFTNHQKIAEQTNTSVYFAYPYHSWERGLNENTNGLIRQYVPKQQNFRELDEDDFSIIQDRLNNRPRKALGFLTPIEFIKKYQESPPVVAFET